MNVMEKAVAFGQSLPREEGLAVMVIVHDLKTGQIGWGSSLPSHESIVVMSDCLTSIIRSRAS